LEGPNRGSRYIDTLTFADGSTLSLTSGLTIAAPTGTATLWANGSGDTLIGGAGTDTLIANSTGTASEVFIAGQGSTTIWGSNSGGDTISYAAGDGALDIQDYNGSNTLALDPSITRSDLSFTETANGSDLLITDGIAGDTIDIGAQGSG